MRGLQSLRRPASQHITGRKYVHSLLVSDLDALKGMSQLLFCPLHWLGCSLLRLHHTAYCQSKSPCTRFRSKALLVPRAVFRHA